MALSKSNTNVEELPAVYSSGVKTEPSNCVSVEGSLAVSRQSNGQPGPRKMSQAAKSGHMQIFSHVTPETLNPTANGKVAPLTTKTMRGLEMVGQSINATSHSSHGERARDATMGTGLPAAANQRHLSKPILNIGTIDLLSNIPLPEKPPVNPT